MVRLGQKLRIFKYSAVMAIRSMRFRAFRTFLTVLGILIGITTFTSLMAIGVGMRADIREILSRFAGANMIVMSSISSSRPSIPGQVVDYINQIDGINFSAGVIQDFADVSGKTVMITGINPEKMEFLLSLKTIEGQSLKDAKDVPNACVIDIVLQEELNLAVNESFVATSSLTGSFISLKIVGVVESLTAGGGGFGMGMSGICYTDLTTMQDILITTNVQVILVGLEENANSDAVAEAITVAYPEAEVITEEEILAMMDQIVGIINGVLLALSAISLVVGALMIMSTMTMSVLERTREIGIMKSIGAKRSHVLTIFLTEAFLISLVGGVLGVLAAIGAVYAIDIIMTGQYGFSIPYSFEPWIFISSMLLAVGIGLISGAYPSWQASSVKPVEALRYE
ncbi:MAG: ABC transporter permease [Candidatus Helarchaeota archaeon]